MSSEALAWAFKQQVPSAATKFVLVALAECAHYKTGRIYPSIEHIREITSLNRKTIIASIDWLSANGYLIDTGEREGRTKQIKVYLAALERVPETEQSQKRNSTDISVKQSQKRDTEPSREYTPSEDKSSSGKPRASDLPEWVPQEEWKAFVAMRRSIRKPLTGRAITLAVNRLQQLAEDGHPPGAVLDQSTMSCWQKLYPLKGDDNGNRTYQDKPSAWAPAPIMGYGRN